MEKFTYSSILSRLEGFDAWLRSLGLTPRPDDRIHQAFKTLRKAEEASQKGRETGTYSYIEAGDWFPIIEALEAHDIFNAFHDDSSPALAAALKRALSGPLQPIRENSKNRDGRNVWYELALAAEWRLRGASVSLGEPDLRLSKDGVTFLVACKRPANRESIQANILGAVKQLRRNLDKAPDSFFGIVAISLSCTVNAGDKVFSGEISDLRTLLKNELDRFSPSFLKIRDPKICCVVFHIITPGVDEGVDMVRASFAAAQELIPSLGSNVFGQHALEMSGRSQ